MILSRRALLGLLVALPVAAGCSPARRVAAPAPPDPALGSAARAEGALVALYRHALAVVADPTGQLSTMLAEHEAHLAALPAGSAPAAAPGTLGPAPLAALAAIEQRAAADRLAECLAARPADAALLASIAASEACHAAILRTLPAA